MEINRKRNPPNKNAGKPIAKIFNEGAARVIIPTPILRNNIATMTGIAIKSAPKKIIEDQGINLP